MTNLTKKQFTQTEKIVISFCAVLVALTVYGITHFSGKKIKITSNASGQINYEMAKVSQNENLYSLENREIEMNYKALSLKTAQKSAISKVDTVKTKATELAKKAIEQKMTKENALAKAADAQRKLDAKRMNQKNNQVNSEIENKLEQAKSLNHGTDSYAQAMFNNPIADAAKESDVKSDKKSYNQWRTEIFTAQNKETILKLSAAYKKGEVSSDDFQKLVFEMINSKDDKMVGLGLYALRTTPSSQSYIQLVKVQGSVNSTYAAYVQDSLLSYNQTNQLSILKQNLLNQDKVVVLKTLEIIKTGLNSIKSGEVSALVDSRNGRDISSFSINSYVNFLPALKSLVSGSNDQDVINLASQNISLIDDPQYVAGN